MLFSEQIPPYCLVATLFKGAAAFMEGTHKQMLEAMDKISIALP